MNGHLTRSRIPMRTGRTEFRSCIVLALAAAVVGPAGAGAAEEPRPVAGGLPVVFVPGTSGSILKFRDGSVFWLDSSSLAPALVAKGALNASGGEAGVEALTTAGIVDA